MYKEICCDYAEWIQTWVEGPVNDGWCGCGDKGTVWKGRTEYNQLIHLDKFPFSSIQTILSRQINKTIKNPC